MHPRVLALIEAAQLHVHHKLDVVTLVLPSDAAEPGASQVNAILIAIPKCEF